MQNYHRHTSYSNIFTPDSAAINEDYAKRAVECGHKVISSVEHGWQGYYYETFELAKKYNLKFIFGAEAYWVKDRFEKDRTNSHIILLAKSEAGRRAINRILSEANETGYFYKPRIDIPLLMSLPKDDVFLTSACVAGWQYDDADDIMHQLAQNFGDNFMFEVQNHNTDKQKDLNRRIIELSERWGTKIIAGLDSHFIYPNDAQDREYILEAKKIRYEDEDGWYMDYPDDNEVVNRFKLQGVLSDEQITQAMNNADVMLDFLDFTENNRVFSKEIKLPSLYPDKTQAEKNKIYSQLISKKFLEYTKGMPKDEVKRYYEGVKEEVDTYKETGMVDYPLIDMEILEEALRNGGMMTYTGRGSGSSYFTNTLCGFSSIDRFVSPIHLYPERFISKARILETKSLPDLDLNVGTPEIFEEAQKTVMSRIKGENHCYPMIAFGTAKRKAAFKLYARAANLDFNIANSISEQISKYEEALKYAEEDDEILISDYVSEEYMPYIEQSNKYLGIIMDKKKAPCSYLLYDGDLREEIGLIKCKSETTKKEYITAVVDGAIAENYKFLKNDILKVDTVLQTKLVFDRIGMQQPTTRELMKMIDGDNQTWSIYSNGLTIGVNQCEKESTTQKLKRYKPQNISQLCAFVAAIRPGFKSKYKMFESKKPFSYGIKTLDKLIQTKQFPYSYMLYQEMQMAILNYAGFPMGQCYGIIKAIAKKHPEKVKPLKSEFLKNFSEKMLTECGSLDLAKKTAQDVWTIIDQSAVYVFNASHSLCVALDSLYSAWQKAHYPYEFYEVMLQMYSDKGKKDKVTLLKSEMKHFGIAEGKYAYGNDNRKFVADKEHHTINPALVSIKGMSQKAADDLYSLSLRHEFIDFYSLWSEICSLTSVNSAKRDTLIDIGYFDAFAKRKKIMRYAEIFDSWNGRSQFKKEEVLNSEYADLIKKYSTETDKQFRNFDFKSALIEVWDAMKDDDISIGEKWKYEFDSLGYTVTEAPQSESSDDYYIVQDVNTKYSPRITAYDLCTGTVKTMKMYKRDYENRPVQKGDIIQAHIQQRNKSRMVDGKWQKIPDEYDDWIVSLAVIPDGQEIR